MCPSKPADCTEGASADPDTCKVPCRCQPSIDTCLELLVKASNCQSPVSVPIKIRGVQASRKGFQICNWVIVCVQPEACS